MPVLIVRGENDLVITELLEEKFTDPSAMLPVDAGQNVIEHKKRPGRIENSNSRKEETEAKRIQVPLTEKRSRVLGISQAEELNCKTQAAGCGPRRRL